MSRLLFVFLTSFLAFGALWAETPPSAPSLLTPANGFVSTNSWIISHTWTASTDDFAVTNYYFAFQTNGATPVSNSLGSNTLIKILTNQSNMSFTYSWWVLARDNSNHVTSSATNFYSITNQTDVTAPSAAVCLSPISGTISNTNLTFYWQAATDNVAVTGYTLWILTNGGLYYTFNTSQTNFSTNVTTGYSNNISWTVRAYDAAGNSTPSITNSFVWYVPSGVDSTPPTTPILVSPAASSTLTSTNATFYWNASSDNVAVTGYQLILLTNGTLYSSYAPGTSTNFSVGQSTNFSNSFTWFVKVWDAAGNTNTSTSNTFTWNTVTNGAYTLIPPSLTSPAAWTKVTNTYDFTFAWGAPTSTYAITGYWFKYIYNLTNAFTNTLSLTGSNWITAPTTSFYTNFPTGVAHTNGGLVWSVGVVDVSNHLALSSNLSIQLFSNSGPTNDTTAPVAGTLVSPTNGATITNATTAFSWTPATDNVAVSSYTLTLRMLAGIYSNIPGLTGTNASVGFPAGFSSNMTWWVTAYDAAGNSALYASNQFLWNRILATNTNVDTTAPVAGTLVNPTNGATMTNATTAFSWTPATDNVGVSSYTLTLRMLAGIYSNISGLTATNASVGFPAGFSSNMTWWVTAYDTAGNSALYASNQFLWDRSLATNTNVDATAPVAGTLLTPTNGAFVTNAISAFSWTPATDNVGVSSYTLTLHTTTGIYSNIPGLTGTNASVWFPSGFSSNMTWWVTAYDAAGNSGLYASNQFTWDRRFPTNTNSLADTTAPTLPTLLTPRSNISIASNYDRVLFSCGPSTDNSGTVYYSIMIRFSHTETFIFTTLSTEREWVIDLSSVMSGITTTVYGTWYVQVKDPSGNLARTATARFTITPPPAVGKADYRPLVQDPIGQQILTTATNSVAILSFMASTSNTVVPPIYAGEVPLKYKVNKQTGETCAARMIRVYDRNGRLIFEKPAPRGAFASWDKRDRSNKPVVAGLYLVEISYEDGSVERSPTVVPR